MKLIYLTSKFHYSFLSNVSFLNLLVRIFLSLRKIDRIRSVDCTINIKIDFVEQNDSTKQFSKSSYFFCLCDWITKRRKIFQKYWKRRKKSKTKNKWTRQKKKRKMKNEMNETLIFYLIRKSIFSNFFHFVIFALAFMFSLNELMLRIFFIVMYKIFDVLNIIDL